MDLIDRVIGLVAAGAVRTVKHAEYRVEDDIAHVVEFWLEERPGRVIEVEQFGTDDYVAVRERISGDIDCPNAPLPPEGAAKLVLDFLFAPME